MRNIFILLFLLCAPVFCYSQTEPKCIECYNKHEIITEKCDSASEELDYIESELSEEELESADIARLQKQLQFMKNYLKLMETKKEEIEILIAKLNCDIEEELE